MKPLYDQAGSVKAWLSRESQWMLSLTGQPLAYLHDDSVYDLSGNHVAWWQDEKLLDHQGDLLVVGPDVPHSEATRRSFHTMPLPPTRHGYRTLPTLRGKPTKPLETMKWALGSKFFKVLSDRAVA